MSTNNSNRAVILCFTNHKGGVGKTCSSCNVGAGLAKRGHKVLLVDLDPQANLSMSYGVKDADMSSYQLLRGEAKPEEVIVNVLPQVDLIPSSLDLAGAEVELAAELGREMILGEILNPLTLRYDYIIIDCSPTLGLLTANALTAANIFLVPLQAQYLSIQGISKIMDIVTKIKRRLNKNLNLGGVFITQYDSRKTLNRDISDAVYEHFGEATFKAKIRDNIALAEAPSSGQDIFRYNPKSNGAQDYLSLVDEIINRTQKIKQLI